MFEVLIPATDHGIYFLYNLIQRNPVGPCLLIDSLNLLMLFWAIGIHVRSDTEPMTRRSVSGLPAVRIVSDLIRIVLLIVGILKTVNRFYEPIWAYDEGFLLIVLCSLNLFYFLGRSDAAHALFSIVPAIMVLSFLVDGMQTRIHAGSAVALIAYCVLLVFPVRAHFLPVDIPPTQEWQQSFRRYARLPEEVPERWEVLHFITSHTNPGEPIYVGLTNHERLIGDRKHWKGRENPDTGNIFMMDSFTPVFCFSYRDSWAKWILMQPSASF